MFPKPRDFAELVQSALAMTVVAVFLYLAITDPAEFKDPMITLTVAASAFWLGSSQGSKAKQGTQNEKTTGNP